MFLTPQGLVAEGLVEQKHAISCVSEGSAEQSMVFSLFSCAFGVLATSPTDPSGEPNI